jgi:hypothetical protein
VRIAPRIAAPTGDSGDYGLSLHQRVKCPHERRNRADAELISDSILDLCQVMDYLWARLGKEKARMIAGPDPSRL